MDVKQVVEWSVMDFEGRRASAVFFSSTWAALYEREAIRGLKYSIVGGELPHGMDNSCVLKRYHERQAG